ncbi:MAG TPA: penicillin acylase family protein [Nocardioides sp.]|nr:penicillin acylase family protein [Nocardioides sp.]
MRRSLLLTGLSGLLVAALATGPAASPSNAGTTPSYGGDPYGALWNILPPGSRGNISATQLAQVLLGGGTTAVDGKNAPASYADQLEMYDALTKQAPSSITRADLSSLYKRENFTPQVVTSDEKPKAGVDIQRDQFGVPYITGTTYDDTMYGAGFAAIEDRMFLMDVLRHTGAGRMAEFVGDTPANVAMDQAQLRTAFYTPAEAAAQVTHVAQRYGAAGERLLHGLDAYIAGINAAQQKLCPLGVAGLECPAEYAALQKTVQPWTRADVVYVASLVGGIFGKGGGAEAANATYLQLLRHRFGAKIGDGVYRDLREKLDAGAPTTGSVDIGYGGGRGLDLGKPGVALPDLGGATAPGSGHIASRVTTPGASPKLAPGLPAGEAGQLQKVRLGFQHGGMSNAVLVTGKESTTGHPLAVFGPQTGYYNPQLLVEQVLKGPGVYARGVSFAGTNLVVELGRGKDYAWSATSASNDLVDTVAERLCNTDGSRPTVDSTAYRVGSRCVPMRHDQHVEHTTPNLTAPGLPKTYTFDVWRTRHGIVQSRTTVRGVPAALVLQRSTYGHEVDSVLGFAQFNDPGYVHSVQSFFKAASHVDFTFNWFYVDSKHIGFYTSSLLPKRAPGVAFDFPRWGDPKYDWQGYVGMAGHAHQVDPASGYLVSWNNRQTKTWSAPDDIWAWGDVHRSLALSQRVKAAIRGPRKIAIQQLVGVMAGAASQDSRARYLLPDLLAVIGNDRALAPATSLLRQWSRGGAPRVDRARTGAYGYQAAIALFDYWYQHGSSSLAYDVMRGRLGSLVTRVPQILDDHPRLGRGSSWLDAPWYSWVKKELDARLGHPEATPFTYRYCGSGTLASCRKVLRASLASAVAYALKTQGVTSVAKLTYDKAQDDIVSQTAGVVGVRPIDWQNRPTFQQVVEFHRHR